MNHLPFEIVLTIFKFLDSKTQIKFMASFKNGRKLIDFCIINFEVMTFKGIEKSPYFESFTNLHIINKLYKFPKRLKILKFGVIYNSHDFQKIRHFNFLNLTHLELFSQEHVYLRKWKLPLLENLDIVYCNNCILDECNFPMLTFLCISLWFNGSLKYCRMPSYTKIIRYSRNRPNTSWPVIDFETGVYLEETSENTLTIW